MTEEERRRQQDAGNADDTFEPIEGNQQNIPAAQTPATAAGNAANSAPAASAYGVTPLNHVDLSQQERNLRQQYDAANQQAQNQIDYATGRAVNELARTQQDAQQQFQTQYNQIDRDEARARDNQALYSAARGDRGGIGAAQYDAIANAAATNRQTVRSAQTQLATDTQRQISDLRAQGEYQKADALLSATQQYLAQLNQLQLDAIQMNLSIDQFNAQLGQWAKEYELQLQQLDLQESQFVRQLAESARQFDAAQALSREQLAEQRRQYDTSLAYQKSRDIVSDAQWQAQMDQQAKQWADQMGLSQAQFLSQLQQWAVSRQDQLNRYAVEDARYADETAYARGRDAVNDARYADETAYARGRDAVNDARYADETAYNRRIAQRNFDYQVSRDKVSDARYEEQFKESVRQFNVTSALQSWIAKDNSKLSWAQMSETQKYNALNYALQKWIAEDGSKLNWAQMSETQRQNAITNALNEWIAKDSSLQNWASIDLDKVLANFNMTETRRMNDNTIRATDANIRQGDRSLDLQAGSLALDTDRFNFTRSQTAIENARADRNERTQNQYNARNSILALISAGVPVSDDMITAAGLGGLSKNDLDLIARINQATSTANAATAQANADLARITAADPYGTKYTSKSSATSGAAGKPNMSESALNDNLLNGVNTAGVREAYQYYYGENYYTSHQNELSATAKGFINRFKDSIKSTGDNSLTGSRRAMLNDAMSKHHINDDELGYILEYFGWI